MAMFVHYCSEKDVASIRRHGLRAGKARRGIYATPMTPHYFASHQWGRELVRNRDVPMSAVYFRVPGTTKAVYGHFNERHAEGTADDAVGAFMHRCDKLGFETILLDDVAPQAITSIKRVQKVGGWRYYPAAKGRAPCTCAYCQRGQAFSNRIAGVREERLRERQAMRRDKPDATET